MTNYDFSETLPLKKNRVETTISKILIAWDDDKQDLKWSKKEMYVKFILN